MTELRKTSETGVLTITAATTRYDVADHLRNDEEMRLYIAAAFEEAGDDAAFIAQALEGVARAKARYPSGILNRPDLALQRQP